ncbi:MAG: hypothetical protein VYC82_06525 [Verrucomicrobiota bacterium]|nr:hypothetical protein [Verrucomicrobiota bacterium]
MDRRYKDIIVSDSRSENMVHRLLGRTHSYRTRTRRWMLLANGGLICRERLEPELVSSEKRQSA